MSFDILFKPPYFYVLIGSIVAVFSLVLFFLWRRMGNRITIEVLHPTQEFKAKKVKLQDIYKFKYGKHGKLKTVDPAKLFSHGKKKKFYVNGVTGELIGFAELKEMSKLLSNWTWKEILEFIEKMSALSMMKAKIIDTMPLIIILVLLGAILIFNFLLAKKVGVF